MRLTLLGAAVSAAALSLAASARAQEVGPPSFPPLVHPQPTFTPPPPPGLPPPVLPPPILEPLAQEPPHGWGLHSADTVPRGEYMVYAELGWPDLTLGATRGVSDVLDVGLRFSMLYGVEYTLPRDRNGVNDLSFGFGFSVPLRLTAYRNGRISLQLQAGLGLRFDYLDAEPRNAPPFVAFQFPLGADLGVHVTENGTLTFGLTVPLAVQVSPDPAGFLPLLAGLTYEHRITSRFAMSFNLRPGLIHGWNRTGAGTDVALLSQLGLIGRI